MNPQWVEIVHGRHNLGIDPVVHVWGWEVPVYLFLGGLVAGMMILVPARELSSGQPGSRFLRWVPFGAIALISLGMGALFLDLAYKLHVFRFYLSFEPTSPMSWGSWILVAVYPVLLASGLGQLDLDGPPILARFIQWSRVHRRKILWASIVLGVGLGAYTGLLLGTLSARLLWSSALLGPLFLVSGVSTAAALLLLGPLDEAEHHWLTRWDVVAMGAELAILGLMLISWVTGGTPQRAAAALLLGGSYTPHFWALVVMAGLMVPILLELRALVTHRAASWTAPALVLVGGIALRVVLVAAGQVSTFGG